MLTGHARGEPVLLARRGDEVFAIGSVCSHYSGPLGEGLLVDDTVRCPWHHACFSLRTGQPTRPPALNPVACWNVERRGDHLVVTGKREPSTPMPIPSRSPDSVVIVGAGAAGNMAAETLRREGYQGPITLLGADESGPVDRPNLSKDYLAGTAPEDWIPLRPAAFYEEQRITLRTGTRVERLDTSARRLHLAGGETVSYDALLLATGADPVRLDLPGSDLPHVHYLRTLAQSRAIIERAGRSRRAVVIGASFIGLEVAASLRARTLDVHVVGPEARPLERVLGPELGDFVRGLHEEHGVSFHLGTRPVSIDDRQVRLENGELLDADLVVIGVGVRPALALAEQAGLAMDRGVSVNEYLETSVAGIYAAGDIARWPDPHSGDRIRVEHWVVAERQGQVAAWNILGGRVRFEAVPFFWSHHYDVTIGYVGHAERWDSATVDGDLAAHDASVTYRAEGRVLALATVFRSQAELRTELAMERHDRAAVEAAVALRT